jgi:hypothetical protein
MVTFGLRGANGETAHHSDDGRFSDFYRPVRVPVRWRKPASKSQTSWSCGQNSFEFPDWPREMSGGTSP